MAKTYIHSKNHIFSTMKKIFSALLISLLSMAATLSASAQDMQVIRDSDRLYFYGVDFGPVKVVAAAESPAAFKMAFAGINGLFETEPNKYILPLQKKLQHVFNSVDVNAVAQNNASIDEEEMLTYKPAQALTKEELHQEVLVCDIPEREGVGLLIVCGQLNKTTDLGTFYYVFFDNKTFEVKTVWAYSGKSGGIGLRNYWASSLCNTYKAIRPTDLYLKSQDVKGKIDSSFKKVKKGVKTAAQGIAEGVADGAEQIFSADTVKVK